MSKLYHQLVNNDFFTAELSSQALKVTLEYLKIRSLQYWRKRPGQLISLPSDTNMSFKSFDLNEAYCKNHNWLFNSVHQLLEKCEKLKFVAVTNLRECECALWTTSCWHLLVTEAPSKHAQVVNFPDAARQHRTKYKKISYKNLYVSCVLDGEAVQTLHENISSLPFTLKVSGSCSLYKLNQQYAEAGGKQLINRDRVSCSFSEWYCSPVF